MKQLQRVLNAVYFKSGAVDGILGPKTVEAISDSRWFTYRMKLMEYMVRIHVRNLQAVLKSKGY
ncbi:peptidoglycan-binding domain-containing protein [Pseudogracilibacillus auburnensis]|uniref:peptidoglycan-binding domain-containing protein n=1 Tax=Pseudogracilibacillus auburnensis TaxID=1494959 RepID=UPI001A96E95C|nr:peptidoglycan-binding protein [Pseudogracilibacillus auburnensis]